MLALLLGVLGSPRTPSREGEAETEEREERGAEDASWQAMHARVPRGSRLRLRAPDVLDAGLFRTAGFDRRAPTADTPRPRWSKPRRGLAPPDDDDSAA